jgi:hypothetical protein
MAASVALVCMPSCSGGGEPVTVNERMFLRVGDVLIPKGGGCSWTKIPSMGQTSSGGVDGDISVREGPEGDAFVVRVFSDQELLASRSYGVAMLNSGKLDEFTVSTHSNAVYLFRYWGGVCADLAAPSP